MPRDALPRVLFAPLCDPANEPDAAALTADLPDAEKPLLVIRRELNPKAPADMTLADYSQVHDLYEAQPTFQHRLWKGASDLSAKVWFGRGGLFRLPIRLSWASRCATTFMFPPATAVR